MPRHGYRQSLADLLHRKGNFRYTYSVGDVTRSSLSAAVSNRESQRCRFDLNPAEALEVRIFVDRSVVEVFANRRHYLAMRIYPERRDSLGVQVFARGGSAMLRSLEAWEIAAIWPMASAEGEGLNEPE